MMKKKLFLNTFKKVMIGTFCAVAVASNFSVFTNASGNWGDTSFKFNFQGKTLYTAMRAKFDDTSSYMKCDSIVPARSYVAYVVGGKNDTDISHIDMSGGHRYTFTAGTTYKMINYVHENGYTYAGIASKPNYTTAFTATGVWSPDSI